MISKLENFLISVFIRILNILSLIPNTYFYLKTPSKIFLVVYYAIIIFLLIIIRKWKYSFIKILYSKKYLVKFIQKVKLIVVRMNYKRIIIYILIICLISSLYTLNFDLEIHFLDVGQGDCTYIKTPKGKNILIDCGEGNSSKYDEGENVVFPYLLDKKIKKIDYLIISHFDSDHVRRSIFYIKKYESKKCYYK
jgi:competence protein ComEC